MRVRFQFPQVQGKFVARFYRFRLYRICFCHAWVAGKQNTAFVYRTGIHIRFGENAVNGGSVAINVISLSVLDIRCESMGTGIFTASGQGAANTSYAYYDVSFHFNFSLVNDLISEHESHS